MAPAAPRSLGNPPTRGRVAFAVFTMTHSRRPRAALAALTLAVFTLGAIPLASPAAGTNAATSAAKSGSSVAKSATAKKSAAAKTTAKTAKAAAKKTAKPVGYHPKNGLAPADEYFGRLQMSVLGVRNKVKDLGLDADLHPEHGKAVLGNALWVEDAMRDWAKKYPFDRWLPRYAYALEQMYERIPGDDAHRRAVKQVSYLTAYFPQTVYGKVGRAKLAAGIPKPDPSDTPLALTDLERLALIDGKVIPTIPPAATPVPAASPSAAPASLPAPAESPATLPSPGTTTPAPAASARP
ncbi:MAG: hypothetical protein JWM87_1818 [Candidatus Eremiobacteraeota bacterium]|nr:hypothetical protein [Candidatus Eremiobacteraeota bacterium]